LVKLVTGQHEVASNWDTDTQQLDNLSNSNWDWIRLAVAQNPSASEATLLKLAEDQAFKIQSLNKGNHGVREAVLKNPNIDCLTLYKIKLQIQEKKENDKANQILAKRTDSPYALARGLETGDRNVKISAAKNPKTPIQVLEQLAKDQDETVRSVMAQNQNLPLNILLELAEDFSVRIRLNLAHKNNYSKIKTPIPLLEKLAKDESEQVRAKVAEHSDTPVELLVQLANDSSIKICYSLTKNQNTSVEILEFLGVEKGIADAYNKKTPGNALAAVVENTLKKSSREQERIFKFLLRNLEGSQMPASTLEKLATNKTSWIRSNVAHHRNTPCSALEKMIDDKYEPVLWGIARNPNSSPQLLERLLNQNYETVAGAMVERNEIPTNVMEKLLENKSQYVRQPVVSKSNLPVKLAEKTIATEPEESVLISLARNPILTTELLTQFVQHSNANICKTLVNHPNLTLEHWQKLADNPNLKVRQAIASKINAPINILETLAQDNVTDVRVEVAGNNKTPSQVLEQLSQDTEATVRTKVAGNSNTQINILEILAEDESVEVRRAVANNFNTPEVIKNSLKDLLPATKSNNQIISPTLRGLSRIYNPDTDDLPRLLSEYTNSDVAFVKFVSLLHPLTPKEILEAGVNSVSWLERYAIADNPNTPTEIKQQLTQDSNQIVRAVARDKLTS
jgi:hypothetical protein